MLRTRLGSLDWRKRSTTRTAHAPMSVAARIGAAILLIHLLVAIFGPFLAPYSPSALVSTKAFAAPGEGGLLGTDYLGRDLLSRLLYGAAPTIGLALVATLLAFALGIGLGFVAGLRAGWADSVISRSVDVLMSFPPILLALIVIASLGTSTPVLLAMVAIVQAPRIARVARAIAMDIVAQDFVDVARARGESTFSMLRREILPNSLRPLSVEFGIRLTVSVLFLSSLSFLGLGLQPPAADWGIMVRENLSGLNAAALAALFPAAAIGSLTVAVNLVIDWLASRADRQIAQERGL